jgi:hypothetical protein
VALELSYIARPLWWFWQLPCFNTQLVVMADLGPPASHNCPMGGAEDEARAGRTTAGASGRMLAT